VRVEYKTGITDAGYKDARSSGNNTRLNDSGYQRCSDRLLSAKIPKLFLRTAECVARERNRFARIIGESGGEAVDCGIIASNQIIET